MTSYLLFTLCSSLSVVLCVPGTSEGVVHPRLAFLCQLPVSHGRHQAVLLLSLKLWKGRTTVLSVTRQRAIALNCGAKIQKTSTELWRGKSAKLGLLCSRGKFPFRILCDVTAYAATVQRAAYKQERLAPKQGHTRVFDTFKYECQRSYVLCLKQPVCIQKVASDLVGTLHRVVQCEE